MSLDVNMEKQTLQLQILNELLQLEYTIKTNKCIPGIYQHNFCTHVKSTLTFYQNECLEHSASMIQKECTRAFINFTITCITSAFPYKDNKARSSYSAAARLVDIWPIIVSCILSKETSFFHDLGSTECLSFIELLIDTCCKLPVVLQCRLWTDFIYQLDINNSLNMEIITMFYYSILHFVRRYFFLSSTESSEFSCRNYLSHCIQSIYCKTKRTETAIVLVDIIGMLRIAKEIYNRYLEAKDYDLFDTLVQNIITELCNGKNVSDALSLSASSVRETKNDTIQTIPPSLRLACILPLYTLCLEHIFSQKWKNEQQYYTLLKLLSVYEILNHFYTSVVNDGLTIASFVCGTDDISKQFFLESPSYSEEEVLLLFAGVNLQIHSNVENSSPKKETDKPSSIRALFLPIPTIDRFMETISIIRNIIDIPSAKKKLSIDSSLSLTDLSDMTKHWILHQILGQNVYAGEQDSLNYYIKSRNVVDTENSKLSCACMNDENIYGNSELLFPSWTCLPIIINDLDDLTANSFPLNEDICKQYLDGSSFYTSIETPKRPLTYSLLLHASNMHTTNKFLCMLSSNCMLKHCFTLGARLLKKFVDGLVQANCKWTEKDTITIGETILTILEQIYIPNASTLFNNNDTKNSNLLISENEFYDNFRVWMDFFLSSFRKYIHIGSKSYFETSQKEEEGVSTAFVVSSSEWRQASISLCHFLIKLLNGKNTTFLSVKEYSFSTRWIQVASSLNTTPNDVDIGYSWAITLTSLLSRALKARLPLASVIETVKTIVSLVNSTCNTSEALITESSFSTFLENYQQKNKDSFSMNKSISSIYCPNASIIFSTLSPIIFSDNNEFTTMLVPWLIEKNPSNQSIESFENVSTPFFTLLQKNGTNSMIIKKTDSTSIETNLTIYSLHSLPLYTEMNIKIYDPVYIIAKKLWYLLQIHSLLPYASLIRSFLSGVFSVSRWPLRLGLLVNVLINTPSKCDCALSTLLPWRDWYRYTKEPSIRLFMAQIVDDLFEHTANNSEIICQQNNHFVTEVIQFNSDEKIQKVIRETCIDAIQNTIDEICNAYDSSSTVNINEMESLVTTLAIILNHFFYADLKYSDLLFQKLVPAWMHGLVHLFFTYSKSSLPAEKGSNLLKSLELSGISFLLPKIIANTDLLQLCMHTNEVKNAICILLKDVGQGKQYSMINILFHHGESLLSVIKSEIIEMEKNELLENMTVFRSLEGVITNCLGRIGAVKLVKKTYVDIKRNTNEINVTNNSTTSNAKRKGNDILFSDESIPPPTRLISRNPIINLWAKEDAQLKENGSKRIKKVVAEDYADLEDFIVFD